MLGNRVEKQKLKIVLSMGVVVLFLFIEGCRGSTFDFDSMCSSASPCKEEKRKANKIESSSIGSSNQVMENNGNAKKEEDLPEKMYSEEDQKEIEKLIRLKQDLIEENERIIKEKQKEIEEIDRKLGIIESYKELLKLSMKNTIKELEQRMNNILKELKQRMEERKMNGGKKEE
ncbi:hypothetical protein NEMIN01_2249 [Nematocida minor]|uniref:uncharacterized protein n=1 Tax=Nematocida minor TaxID=1912983 RepID=UPI00221F8AB2|nr:uncharacterized protein NEMIN01_2249 [Nematocida minor]KAI5192833.1 hypothetical protein NEMIN01_2249 [Nematocida minor]